MRRLISAFLLLAIILSNPAQVLAGTTENVAAVPYNQAVQMAIDNTLLGRDINSQISNIQMLHRDLRDEISRLEGGATSFNRDRINLLRDELIDLNNMLTMAIMHQFNMEQSIGFSMERLLGGLISIEEEGADALVSEALFAVMANMGVMQGMGGDIAMIQMQQALIADEIQRLQDETGFRNILREARNSLSELERQIDRLYLHQEQAELIIELMLRGIIVDMAEQSLQISAIGAQLALAEENQRRLELSYELGFISRHDFDTSEHNLEQSHAQLDVLARNRNISRQNLNYLLGLPLFQPTVITFSRQLPHIPQNPAGRIAEVALQSLTIRALQIDVDSAMGARRAYTGNDRDINISANDRQRAVNNVATDNNNIAAIRNRIGLQDAVERAELGLEQAMRTMEANLHRAYANFEGLAAHETTLRRELAQAQAVLEAATVSFELGHITRLDVDEVQLAILLIEQDIERILNQKWVLAFMLENPSLLQ